MHTFDFWFFLNIEDFSDFFCLLLGKLAIQKRGSTCDPVDGYKCASIIIT